MKISNVVRLRQIARKWRRLASIRKVAQAFGNKFHRTGSTVPPDVPSGHLAVYVGQQCSKRFVIRATYLNHPVFRALLEQAKEDFGYARQGGLVIPWDEFLFEHILRLFSRIDPAALRQLDLEAVKTSFFNEWHFLSEANGIFLGNDCRPLLHGFAEQPLRARGEDSRVFNWNRLKQLNIEDFERQVAKNLSKNCSY